MHFKNVNVHHWVHALYMKILNTFWFLIDCISPFEGYYWHKGLGLGFRVRVNRVWVGLVLGLEIGCRVRVSKSCSSATVILSVSSVPYVPSCFCHCPFKPRQDRWNMSLQNHTKTDKQQHMTRQMPRHVKCKEAKHNYLTLFTHFVTSTGAGWPPICPVWF